MINIITVYVIFHTVKCIPASPIWIQSTHFDT